MQKKFILVYIVCLFIVILVTAACSTGQPPEAAATEPSESTPEDTGAPAPTPKPFNLEQLSGFLIYSPVRLNAIQIASPDWSSTEVLVPLPNGILTDPVWSPDGHYIVYSFFEMERGLYYELRLFDYAEREDSSLTPQHIEGTVTNFSWSPDERYVAFDLLEDGNDDRELYLIDIKTRELFNLTNDPETLDQEPAWSPAGDVIAFSSDRDGSFDIWTVTPTENDPWTATPGGHELHNLSSSGAEAYHDSRPSWSPDGSRIAFYRQENVSTSLWLMEADGSGQRMLLELGNVDYSETPVWSPNGEWIALISGANPLDKVWLVNPTTGEYREVSAKPGRYGYVSWAPDSSAIAYEEVVHETGTSVVHLHALDGEHDYSWEIDTIMYFLQWSPVDELP